MVTLAHNSGIKSISNIRLNKPAEKRVYEHLCCEVDGVKGAAAGLSRSMKEGKSDTSSKGCV